jgi:hypothetical protein
MRNPIATMCGAERDDAQAERAGQATESGGAATESGDEAPESVGAQLSTT